MLTQLWLHAFENHIEPTILLKQRQQHNTVVDDIFGEASIARTGRDFPSAG